jgi:dissimilatory sulfite reductase related protein
MTTKTFAGKLIQVNEEGYFLNPAEWNREIAIEVAKEEGIQLNDMHLALIDFIRDRVEKGEALTIRSIGKSGIIDIKGFYELFPGAPLKKATKIAGVGKPTSCV